MIGHGDAEGTEERSLNGDKGETEHLLNLKEPQHVLSDHAGPCHEAASSRRTRFGMMNPCGRNLAREGEAEKGGG